MTNIKKGDMVLIKSNFLASNDALEISIQNGHYNWKPFGIVQKIPTYKQISEENGPEWEIADNYHVQLYQNPFAKRLKSKSKSKNKTKNCSIEVICLDKNDLEIIG